LTRARSAVPWRESILCLALAAGGCAGTERASAVTTEAKAIRIARERCQWTQPFDPALPWRAALHDGQWHVWLWTDSDRREPAIGALDIWIRASDGKAGVCNHA
jgi:hypothetical protein